MKALLIKVLLIIVTAGILETYFEFWVVLIICAAVNILVSSKGFTSFLSGFLAIGFLWFFYSFYLDIQSESLINIKIAEILKVSKNALISIVVLLGSLLGGIGSYTGYSIRKLIPKKIN